MHWPWQNPTWQGESFDWNQIDAVVGILTAVATLAAAAATFAAVVVAVLTAIFATMQARAADARARRAEAERDRAAERAEAALISINPRPPHVFIVLNGSSLPIRFVRVYAITPNQEIYTTTEQAVLQPGGHAVLARSDRGQTNLLDHHAVVFRNHAGHQWAWFAGGEVLRLSDHQDVATLTDGEIVGGHLLMGYRAYLSRMSARLPGNSPRSEAGKEKNPR